MRVLLVTSDREQCGIREYGRMLIEALGRVAGDVEIEEFANPNVFALPQLNPGDIVHVNHHAALHASWREDQVYAVRYALRQSVVVTQHDTFETFSLMQERGFPDFRCADALVVHEPVEGLESEPNVHFIRQGVLPFTPGPWEPKLVGTCGFPFPWKGHANVAAAAAAAGWRCLLIAPGATVEQAETWQMIAQGNAEIVTEFLPREEVVRRLSFCQATAFLYSTGNSGTSAAIRLGLAARRPLLAYPCRQFRDLDAVDLLRCDTLVEVVMTLRGLENEESFDFGCGISERVAERDSWDAVARRYAEIYRSCITRRNA